MPALPRVLSTVILYLAIALRLGALGFTSRTWHSDHGLPQHTVQAILQTRDGALWIGTRFGLARFDGASFRNFLPVDHPEFRDGSISALSEGRDGTLWIGTLQGLLRHQAGRFHRIEALTEQRIWALWVAPDDTLWMGLSQGVGRLRDGALTIFRVPDGSPSSQQVRSLSEDGRGGLWVLTLKGIWHLDLTTGQWEAQGPTWAPTAPPTTPQPAQGDWQLGSDLGRDPAAFIQASLASQSPDRGLNRWGGRLVADGPGRWWWVDDQRRLLALGPAGVRELRANQSPAPEILCVYRDREGSLWLGTAWHGLVRLRPTLFDTVELGNGEQRPCFTVAPTRDGLGVWTATKADLWQIGGSHPQPFPIFATQEPHQIMSVLPATSGGLWVARDRDGLFRWDGQFLHPVPLGLTERETRLRALFEDRQGRLWVGRRGGVSRLEAGQVLHLGAADGLPPGGVGSFAETRDGRLWLGTDGRGVAWWESGKLRFFGPAEGLAGDTVWGIVEETGGAVWLHGRGGLTRWHQGRFQKVTRAEGLFDELNNQMLPDSAGNYWLGCNRGIYRVRADDLHAVADGRLARLHCVQFGASDGLPVAETNGETHPAGAVTADGTLWFPSPAGVIRAHPHQLQGNEVSPLTLLAEVRTDAGPILGETGLAPHLRRDPDGTLQLPPRTARVLEFRYASSSYADPDRVRFRYRLLGYESAWAEAGGRRVAYYTNLRPGRYVFEVESANNHGVWSDVPARFALRLQPAFHQTAAFPWLLGGLIGSSAWAAHRLRLHWVRRRLELQRQLDLARERERIARDMHDDVGAALTQIGLLTERALRAPPDDVRPLLGRIAQATRETAQSADEIVWAVNPQQDRLDHLADYICQFAREFLEPSGVRCRLDVPAVVPELPVASDLRHHLLMVLKESLHNALRHAHAREIEVGLALTDTQLVLRIRDDGVGFDPSAPPPGAGGNGLPNLHQRIASLGGQLQVASQPGIGTRIVATLPRPRPLTPVSPRSWD